MKITKQVGHLNEDYGFTDTIKPMDNWKPTAYFILGIIMLIIFAAIIGYMVYCAIEA